MNIAFTASVAFVVGFLLGAGGMLHSWEESAQRGGFEVGHVLYKAEPIKP